jgi:hypothetical protein
MRATNACPGAPQAHNARSPLSRGRAGPRDQ